MAITFKPPAPLPAQAGFSVFLAGSIEMGAATRWQEQLEADLADCNLLIFNPRRDAWDSSWEQSIDNPRFREQVEWELGALEQASLVAMYLDPATRAPISLLELGLFAHSGKVIVCCPNGFWRKGNVDIVCARYGVRQVETLTALTEAIRNAANSRVG